MSDPQQDDVGSRAAAADADAGTDGPDEGREPSPRAQDHEATDGARFRAGQDSVEVNDSGIPASRAYGTEGATVDEVDPAD